MKIVTFKKSMNVKLWVHREFWNKLKYSFYCHKFYEKMFIKRKVRSEFIKKMEQHAIFGTQICI